MNLLKPSVLLIALPLLLFAQAQQQPCKLTVAQAPELRGFKLGMLFEDAERRSAKWYSVMPADEFGRRGAIIGRNPTEPDFKGVEAITLEFVDNHLARVSFHYDRSTLFKSGDEFARQVGSALNLPNLWEPLSASIWEGGILRCDGFELEAGMTTNFLPVLQLSASAPLATIEQRRARAKELQRRTFRP